ncbi:MAG: penicillin-binding protein [Erysipelotrichaceae bacterium]|nr:penicillin-binding protein [Erysipelotrichaceae bacterium]
MSEPRKKRRKLRLGAIVLFLILCLYIAAAGYGFFFMKDMLSDKPELNITDFISQETSHIYDAHGNVISEVGDFLRDNITYDQIPDCVIDAFLATEDARFFQHQGVDIPRFTKILIDYARTGSTFSGGSTFTMQLVRNTYFSIEDGENAVERERTLRYKVQQTVLALELERHMGKKDIFMLYLNKLNFGKQIRGIQKAALYYFGKNCTELNTAEAALLAGIINLPNIYNPYANLDYSTERRNEVLDLMVRHGYISEEECQLAKGVKVEDMLVGEGYISSINTKYQAYVDAVIEEVIEMTGEDPARIGMEIYTALEPEIQIEIESIENGSSGISFPNSSMQTGIVAMNNQNGEVVGIGGGRYYSGIRVFNRATMQYKQPGSSIKPVLSYALGFEYLGYSLDEILIDKPTTFPGESRILTNSNGTYQGDVTIKDAVGMSLNTPAVQTLERVEDTIGSEGIISYLQSVGFMKVNEETYNYQFAIGGSTFEVTPMELAGAHAAMINLGVYNKPHTIRKIVTTKGETIIPPSEGTRVLSSGSAWLVDELMENNVSGGYTNFMNILERDYPVYAKTGTTDWGTDGLDYGIPEGASKDSWMVSSTSKYTNAVWLGWDQAQPDAYFTWDMINLDIPGRINQRLLDAEERVSPDDLDGVSRPDDVVDAVYVYGTYPHVQGEEDLENLVETAVSETGLENMPSVSASDAASSAYALPQITAKLTGAAVIIRWNTSPVPCSGARDISLHDYWHDVNMSGACLVDNTGLYSGDYTYYADIYANDQLVTTVSSTNGLYLGTPADMSGEIKVCGYVTTSGGTSDQACRIAGYLGD